MRAAPRTFSALVLAGASALVVAGCLDWGSLYGPRCGDGERGADEACDDGNTIDGDGCDGACHVEPPVCGDGRTSGTEECDDANSSDEDACLEGCRAARCGDGATWFGTEECDDGNTNDGDGCSAACRLEVNHCGDGAKDPPEECDDGNRDPGDGCSAACTIEPPPELCGNGVVDPGEACDDGNRDNTDSCLNGCSVAACGDGFVRGGVEECDDGNHDNGDGCSSVCLSCDTGAGVFFRAANGHCYTFTGETAGFFAAAASCDSGGGYLWTSTSQAEGKDVTKALLGAEPPVWLALRTDTSPPQWITGEPTRYQSWDPGEPAPAPSSCALQRTDGANTPLWFTAPCGEAHLFVCEREPPFMLPDHHAYRLRTSGRTWDVAGTECEDSGGHLVTIESEQEQTLLAKHYAADFWIGAKRTAAGDFAWVTGAPLAFTAFASGEPNGPAGKADCLAFNRGDDWLDADCTLTKRFLCEYE